MDYQFLTQAVLAVGTLIVLESILSVDNAIVISRIANREEGVYRQRALTYGLLGALIFRFLFLFSIEWFYKNPEIGGLAKFIGALYLVKLGYGLFFEQDDSEETPSWITYLLNLIGISGFWLTVVNLEVIDIVFSLDNGFAAIAFTENIKGLIWGLPANIVLTYIGVGIGIIIMRLVAIKVTELVDKNPELITSAGVVIILLGLKLLLSGIFSILEFSYFGDTFHSLNETLSNFKSIFESHYTDIGFSIFTLIIFIFPILKNTKFNWRKIVIWGLFIIFVGALLFSMFKKYI